MPWEPREPDIVPDDAVRALEHEAKRRKAEQEITRKWDSLGGAPGVPSGDLVEIGIGFYRQYVYGRIYYNYHYSNALYVHGAIGDKYAQLNGPSSGLGWPTSDEQPFPQDGRVTTFDNGAIYWWPDTGAIELGNVSVQYKGLYCFGETDEWSAADEPYVLFGVVPAPPGQPSEAMTQVYTNVDAGDARPDYIELYRGLPHGALLGVALCEQDQGDPDKYREQIKQGVAKVGEAVATGCAALPVVGAGAAPVCAAIWGAAGPEIVEFVNKTLGTDDDLIEKWDWHVTAKEMVTMARAPRTSFWGIEYHLESKLLSDGEASYKVYLDIQPV
jgi:hypothetical protein